MWQLPPARGSLGEGGREYMSIMTRGFLRSECYHVAQENEEKTPSLEITMGTATVAKEHENPSSASNR